ncbi:type 4a pilus biogenesis protein PilO [Psychromonas antarctica]|jgi:type IV pilus assembly protein PilO|uniref:type 4a pilus biogenesis protein PilO n=1 Tax=Psychromonas antarctica TaxID=67573 RepID=UPI001EE89C43|nr:type 4a pilus biogenesis protein PilO [Psychromonas antarctica]MCG6200708.1 type 4a pilus biogenesis protein PilO [Psychromonas antarctica]
MNINELDFETVGSWPALYRAVFIAVVCVILSGLFFYYVTTPQLEKLDTVRAQEISLKNTFKVKAALSANLEVYRAQMTEINTIFEGLLNKLPSKKEVASLLDDISFIGANNGLQFRSINWGVVKDRELSVEVPISLQVVGRYQQIGKFAADIAALPRIVVLDDIKLSKGKGDLLTLNVIAKTYRYKEEK